MDPLSTYLAVVDADLVCTGGLGASSSVALAALSGASRQRTYPVAGYSVLKEQKSIVAAAQLRWKPPTLSVKFTPSLDNGHFFAL